MHETPITGLVLSGRGARAISAAALACNADQFDAAVEAIAKVWEGFRAEQAYRADALGAIRSGAQWLTMLSIGWLVARWPATFCSKPAAPAS